MFASLSGFSPNPPSYFGRQTIIPHDILAFLGFNAGPDHRKAEQRLSISLRHSPCYRKEDIQKFIILIRT